jgi:hypothetical protein
LRIARTKQKCGRPVRKVELRTDRRKRLRHTGLMMLQEDLSTAGGSITSPWMIDCLWSEDVDNAMQAPSRAFRV